MKNIIKKYLSKIGYKLYSDKYIPTQLLHDSTDLLTIEFDHVMAAVILSKADPNDFTFLQVGAFDGVECDPLYKYLQKYKWKGVMLEPQPLPFAKLKNLYNCVDGITVINAAISKTNTKAILYTLQGDYWSKGMATFDKASILKHDYLIPGIENFIKPIEITCLPFEEVINSSTLKHLDLLQIDTEGFDAEIIKMFPFNIFRPSIIHFESKHLNKTQLEDILEFLIVKGYKIARDGGEDMLAYNETATAGK